MAPASPPSLPVSSSEPAALLSTLKTRQVLSWFGPAFVASIVFVQKSTFRKLDVCTIFEPRMKKWVPKSECTRKIEWDRSVLKILTFFLSRSKVHLVKAFSLSLFFFFSFFFAGSSDRVKFPGRSGLNLDKRVNSG